MKNKILMAVLAFVILTGSLSAMPAAPDEIGKWLQERALKAAPESGRSAGSYDVISIDELDAPESVKQQLRSQYAANDVAAILDSEQALPTQEALLAVVPRTRRPESVLRKRLPAPPSRLRGTVLDTAELLGMEPSGALDGMKSSGLTRFYRVPGVGIVEFSENNVVAAGTKIEVIAEAQNMRLQGEPARLSMEMDAKRRSRAALSWFKGTKAYSLVAIGDERHDVRHNAGVLRQIAEAVVD